MEAESQRTSKNIASILGTVLVAVTISEAINFHIWAVSLPAAVYLNGMILFTAGLALVRFHNRWRRDWAVAVTMLRWAMLLAGLFRLFSPGATQAGDNPITYVFVGSFCIRGLFLSFKAYR